MSHKTDRERRSVHLSAIINQLRMRNLVGLNFSFQCVADEVFYGVQSENSWVRLVVYLLFAVHPGFQFSVTCSNCKVYYVSVSEITYPPKLLKNCLGMKNEMPRSQKGILLRFHPWVIGLRETYLMMFICCSRKNK